MKKQQQRKALYYDRNARELLPLRNGETVRMKPFTRGDKSWKKATVKVRLDDRSYIVEKPRWNVAAQKSSSPEEDNRATNSSSKGQMRDSTTAQTGGRSGQESNIPQGLCSMNRKQTLNLFTLHWVFVNYSY